MKKPPRKESTIRIGSLVLFLKSGGFTTLLPLLNLSREVTYGKFPYLMLNKKRPLRVIYSSSLTQPNPN
ncbi:hypothetical protein SAMN05444487_11625 [Marininema mesophilum]|uniref:Uncharacterized protein n=1 Tax=Marininema mesophilum TaxID=1048340 RepID=A0A1H3B9Q4_9BACL|nr:hypothetical protein SAMN05444487_11625 [Marininema mesophilum]